MSARAVRQDFTVRQSVALLNVLEFDAPARTETSASLLDAL